jgi:hypothetical protein
MASSLVSNWFGPRYAELHPLLQSLHRYGGSLSGSVVIHIPGGFAGWVGRRLAAKLGVPIENAVQAFSVEIQHSHEALHWSRRFGDGSRMYSVFRPIGELPSGYWIEDTGPLKMWLTVDVKDGGWHWRCFKMTYARVPLPLWWFPKSKAFKTIDNGRYRFFVGFSVPLLGDVLTYSGLLDALPAQG